MYLNVNCSSQDDSYWEESVKCLESIFETRHLYFFFFFFFQYSVKHDFICRLFCVIVLQLTYVYYSLLFLNCLECIARIKSMHKLVINLLLFINT